MQCWKSSITRPPRKKKYNWPKGTRSANELNDADSNERLVTGLSPDWFAIHSQSFSVALSLYFYYFSQINPWRFLSSIPSKFAEIGRFFRWREGLKKTIFPAIRNFPRISAKFLFLIVWKYSNQLKKLRKCYRRNVRVVHNFLNRAISFLNNGPLLNITEQNDPGECIAFPVMSLRVVCFCCSFPFCFAFAILS